MSYNSIKIKEEVPEMLRKWSAFLRESFESCMEQIYTRDLF